VYYYGAPDSGLKILSLEFFGKGGIDSKTGAGAPEKQSPAAGPTGRGLNLVLS